MPRPSVRFLLATLLTLFALIVSLPRSGRPGSLIDDARSGRGRKRELARRHPLVHAQPAECDHAPLAGLLDDLQAGGRLPGNDPFVVERWHHRQSARTGLGLGASIASSVVHYRLLTDPGYTSFCDVNATVSCTEAYLSRYGSFAGVPVALGGVMFFTLVLLMTWFGGRALAPVRENSTAYIFALSTVGLAFVLYLAWASFIQLNALCLLCTLTYISVIGIFIVSGGVTSFAMSTLPRGSTVRRDAGLYGYERALRRHGIEPIAGVDEAGRGACAGPLVAGAAILPPGKPGIVPGLADSKLLTAPARERCYEQVVRRAVAWSVVVVPHDECDRLGMHVLPGVGTYAFFDFTPASLEWHKQVAAELWERYGHHPSFYGWYISDEKDGGLGTDEERREMWWPGHACCGADDRAGSVRGAERRHPELPGGLRQDPPAAARLPVPGRRVRPLLGAAYPLAARQRLQGQPLRVSLAQTAAIRVHPRPGALQHPADRRAGQTRGGRRCGILAMSA